MNRVTDHEPMLSLVGMLYDAALDTEKWEPFLAKCCEVFNASAAQWGFVTYKDYQLTYTALYNLNSGDLAKFQSLLPMDPRTPENLDKPWHPGLPEYSDENCVRRFYDGHATHDRMFIDADGLHASELYQKVLKPNNVEYSCAITHKLGNDEYVFLGLMRNSELPEFTLEECGLMDQLSIHVRQAATIHRKLCQLDFDRRAALETLNILNMGLVLVDQYQQVLFSNQLGQGILDNRDGMETNGNSISCSDQTLNQKLRNDIAHVIEETRQGRQTSGRAFSVARPSGKAPYSVLISPLWNNIVRIQAGKLDHPVASIFIQDPAITQPTRHGLLKEYYGLTDTEALVLDALVQGNKTAGIALRMGVQVNTVRQHLKNIFLKTETGSQVELVQTILSSPLWLGTHEFSK